MEFLRAAVAATEGRNVVRLHAATGIGRVLQAHGICHQSRRANRLDTRQIGSISWQEWAHSTCLTQVLPKGQGCGFVWDLAAYSLVGVTHTTASQRAMDGIAGLLSGPVMPWDALICTSSAVATTVKMLLTAEADYLKWRLGAQRFTLPQLPVIPLGVHCDDWATTRKRGREPDSSLVSRRISWSRSSLGG